MVPGRVALNLTDDQATMILVQGARIRRHPGDPSPDIVQLTAPEYVGLLRRVPNGAGLIGVLAVMAEHDRQMMSV